MRRRPGISGWRSASCGLSLDRNRALRWPDLFRGRLRRTCRGVACRNFTLSRGNLIGRLITCGFATQHHFCFRALEHLVNALAARGADLAFEFLPVHEHYEARDL